MKTTLIIYFTRNKKNYQVVKPTDAFLLHNGRPKPDAVMANEWQRLAQAITGNRYDHYQIV